ncbi:hypothetical protein BKI52_17075 [marine bacterium AO1-C]|nr:hypothetical protein BKI52_17075 [marine bacterium AO1-C]
MMATYKPLEVHLLVVIDDKVIELSQYNNGKIIGEIRDKKKTEIEPSLYRFVPSDIIPIFVQTQQIDSITLSRILQLSLLQMPEKGYLNGFNIKTRKFSIDLTTAFHAKIPYSTSEVQNFQGYINQIFEITSFFKTWWELFAQKIISFRKAHAQLPIIKKTLTEEQIIILKE